MGFQHEPADPMGNEPPEIFMRQLKRWVRDNMVLGIQGAKRVHCATGGVWYELPTIPPVATTINGMNPRGEYDPTASYAAKDMVVIRAGANAGTFVCIKAHSGQTPHLPDTGDLYWYSISNNPVMGAWM